MLDKEIETLDNARPAHQKESMPASPGRYDQDPAQVYSGPTATPRADIV